MLHTPGPWEVGAGRMIILDMRDGIPKRTHVQAVEAPLSGYKGVHTDIAYCRNTADAPLFAAALDLHEACKVLLDHFARFAHDRDIPLDDFAKWPSVVQAEAALSKAEGAK